MVQLVGFQIRNQPEALNDNRDLELCPSVHHEEAAVKTLGDTHVILADAPSNRQKGDITNAKAAVAAYGARLAVLRGENRVVAPWVIHAASQIHRLHEVQQQGRWQWVDGLVAKPTTESGASEILPPRYDEDFLRPELASCPDILDSVSSITQDRDPAIGEVIPRDIIVHPEAHLAFEGLFPRILQHAGREIGAGEMPNARDRHLGGFLRLITMPLDVLHREIVMPSQCFRGADNCKMIYVTREMAMGAKTVLICGMIEVLYELILFGPSAPILREAELVVGIVIPTSVPHVEGSELGLQL
mmetsp:Transcript_41014/g.89566  ORF Transcript_41014/g.89566 Transcript_41014/m.89566 type:complete len:301 (+) Transcript_41014:670-1572(+)